MESRPTAVPERAVAGGRAALALASCAIPLWLSGCAAPRQAIVLMPDPDGKVGQAEVSTPGGSQALTKAGDMTTVSGPSAAPAPVTTADPAWIQATFGEALAAEPAPAEKFILYFETGTTTLDAKSRAVLPALVAAIQRRGAVSVAISGHADATGSDQVNDRLALERAEAVKALLVEQGVAAGLLSVSSHGKANPAVPTPEGVPEPRNRRVEVVVQ
jgi:outer membrane protein OmpA-like peptidoglycan-associated protein